MEYIFFKTAVNYLVDYGQELQLVINCDALNSQWMPYSIEETHK